MDPQELTELTPAAERYLEDRGILRAARWAGCKSSFIGRREAIAYPYDGGHGYKVKSITRDERGRRPTKIIGKVSSVFLKEKINRYTDLEISIDLEIDLEISKVEPLKGARPDLEISRDISRDLLESKDHANRSIIVCEGEEDALSCVEAGLINAVSVPHGAINPGANSSPDNAKLNFISEQTDFWRPFQRVIIATDADGPGRAMMAEVARRLGRWRSFLVNFPEGYKDSNEVLVGDSEKELPPLGAAGLRELIQAAAPAAVSGLYSASSFRGDLMRLRRGELGKGESTGFPSLDPFFRVGPGVSVVTGWPKHGKSDVVDQFNVNLAERLGWRTAVWSPENTPAEHIAKLCEKVARKRFFPDMPNLMDEEALERALAFVEEHFKFVSLEGAAATIEAILERFSASVSRWGCRNFVIDPYNAILRPMGGREDDFIVDMLNKTRDFQQAHEAHVWFVAHPKGDPARSAEKVLNGHNISGGPTWWAKCDFGLTVARKDFSTEVHVWACRKAHLGQNGMGELVYNTKTASFEDRDALITIPRPRLVYARAADEDEFD